MNLNCLIDEDDEAEGVYEGFRKKSRRRKKSAPEEENGATGD